MKIVIDARELRTSTGRYVERLLHYLQQLDSKHTFVVLLKPKDMDSWQPSNRRFTKVACRFKEFTFSEQMGLLKQVYSLKPDLVHFAMVQQPILYFGKVVTTIHDLTGTRYRNPSKNRLVFAIKRWVYKWVIKVAARKSKTVITISEFVKDDVAKFARINSRKITVTYEAADVITDNPEPVEELVDRQFIMYVGRPQPHKNLDRLLEAFVLLRQTHPGLRLVLAGKSDELYKRLEKRAMRMGLKNVVFTGFVGEGQLRWLYEHAAVYVFPSLSEGFGLPPLEAMAHGCPVVSSNATCLPEVNGDAALYFDPFNPQEMADKVAEVLDNKRTRQKLIANGHQQIKKYSWKKMAEQTLAVYDQVVG